MYMSFHFDLLFLLIIPSLHFRYIDSNWAWNSTNVHAIIHAPFLGQSAGSAVASVVIGDTNPSARTTHTWYVDAARDLPPLADYSFNSLYNRTYRYTTAPVTFPFGYGLSYSLFTYSNLVITPLIASPCQNISVTLTIQNTSPVDGTEVVQVYASLRNASITPVPIHQLLAFQTVFVLAEASVSVAFVLPPDTRTVLLGNGLVATVEPGLVSLWVGGMSDPVISSKITPGAGIHGGFTINGIPTPVSSC